MHSILFSLWIAAAFTCLSFGFAELLRWQIKRCWLYNPKNLLLPAISTGAGFGSVGCLIALPLGLWQTDTVGPDPSSIELVVCMVVVIGVSCLAWISLVRAQQHVHSWPMRDVWKRLLRVAGPAFLLALGATAIAVALFKNH